MITRFDHVVIAVPDIPAAVEAYRAIGFDVAPGGRHESLGTQNAIIRFGLDYLELLAVEDRERAYARGAFGAEFADFLAHAGGLAGFVLASGDLDQEAAGLARIGQSAEGPFAMDRERPDGRRLSWRLVIPGGSPWRKPWPFLIEWETPDTERITWDASGHHGNGAVGVAGIDLLVEDLHAARSIYETAFALQPADVSENRVSYELGRFQLVISLPASKSETSELNSMGPGPYRLRLRRAEPGGRTEVLPIDAALGARISIE